MGHTGAGLPVYFGGTHGCQRDVVLQTAAPTCWGLWLQPGDGCECRPPHGTSWAAACQHLFFGRALSRKLLSPQLTDSWALAVTRRSVTQALVPSSCDATAPAGESPTGVASPLAGTGIAAILKVSRAKHEMAWLSPCWGRSDLLSTG